MTPTNPTEVQMKLARECAAKAYRDADPTDALAGYVEAGEMDDDEAVQSALLAIQATEARAQGFTDWRCRMKEAERLAERLETEAAAWEHHGNQSEWRETLRSAAALIRSQAEELERLRGALAKATDPTWFYHPDNMESCQFGIWDVIDYYDLPPGKHVCEVECARTLPSIWCAVHVLTAEEKDAMETDESWLLTEHATEQAARAALGER